MSGFSIERQLRRSAAALLDLLLRCRRHPPVGDGGGEDADIGVRRRLHRRQHLRRGLDPQHVDAGRIGQPDRTRHQRHLGAERTRGGGDRVALLAGRAIGDVAHRIDRLVRRPGGDETCCPASGRRMSRRTAAASIAAMISGGSAKPSDAGLAALRHLADVGADEGDAVALQDLGIATGGGVGPHPRIHRRRDQHRLVGRHQHGARQVIGMAARHLRHQVGGGRRDHDQVGLARQPDVADLALVVEIEQVDEDAIAGQRRDRQRRHELRRRPGHHAPHLVAALAQAADQIEALVGGDATADDQQDALLRMLGHFTTNSGPILDSGGSG